MDGRYATLFRTWRCELSNSQVKTAMDISVAPARSCPACGSPESRPQGELNNWKMVECSNCLLVFTRYMPQSADLKAAYESAYSNGGLYQQHLDEVPGLQATGASDQGFYRNRIFLKRYKPEPGDRLLEIGCGVGAFLVAARSLGWSPEGIDVSGPALRHAAANNFPVQCGSLEDFNFPARTFKAVVAWEVLEHLPNPMAALQKIRNILRPEGVFVCSVPNESRFVPRFGTGPAGLPPIHLNYWTPESFKRFARINGFACERLFVKRAWIFGQSRDRLLSIKLLATQVATLTGICEGPIIFAALRPLP
jgi:SAM-dependent methyltransferase